MSSRRGYGDAATRERILRSAWESILESGPEVRLAEVAGRAGVSRQAVYLHFGDRAGLLLELLAWVGETLNLGAMLARVEEASSGIEALRRMVEVHAVFTPQIDAAARALEARQEQDPDVASALRDQLKLRHAAHRRVIARIAAEGDLADGWTVDTAADLFFAVTLAGPWRELTAERGWSAEQYSHRMSQLLIRALVRGGLGWHQRAPRYPRPPSSAPTARR